MTPERALQIAHEAFVKWAQPGTWGDAAQKCITDAILAACREERRAAMNEAASICHRNADIESRDDISDQIDREPT